MGVTACQDPHEEPRTTTDPRRKRPGPALGSPPPDARQPSNPPVPPRESPIYPAKEPFRLSTRASYTGLKLFCPYLFLRSREVGLAHFFYGPNRASRSESRPHE